MTELLQRAFLLASAKPDEEQNALALVLLDGLDEGMPPMTFDPVRETLTVQERSPDDGRRGGGRA